MKWKSLKAHTHTHTFVNIRLNTTTKKRSIRKKKLSCCVVLKLSPKKMLGTNSTISIIVLKAS